MTIFRVLQYSIIIMSDTVIFITSIFSLFLKKIERLGCFCVVCLFALYRDINNYLCCITIDFHLALIDVLVSLFL